MKTAKVKEIKEVREWKGKNGIIYYHNMVMDNNETISLGKKKKDSFHVWQEVSRTEEEKNGRKYQKEYKENTRSGKKQKPNNASFALAYAKDWAVAQLNKGVDVKTENIIKVADEFFTWLKEKE